MDCDTRLTEDFAVTGRARTFVLGVPEP